VGALTRLWLERKAAAEPRPEPREVFVESERRALRELRREAFDHGARLVARHAFKPSVVLGAMRRDLYECREHGDRGHGDHGALDVARVNGALITLCAAARAAKATVT
jgi:hypothetical protein